MSQKKEDNGIKDELLVRRGRNIRFFRKEVMGMTQDKFAEMMEYDSGSSMISQIETGDTDMSPAKLRLAAEIFGVSPVVLDGDHTKKQLRILGAVYDKLINNPGSFKHFDSVLSLLDVTK